MKLLTRVQPQLPAPQSVRVVFYADCEFRAVPVQALCRSYGWHWQVGLKADIAFRAPAGGWQALRDLALQPGQRCYVSDVYLTRQHAFGPVQVSGDWAPQQPHPRDWALDQRADVQAWRRGRKRYWLEPTQRDWKSYGFDLEKSQLDSAERLRVLMLGINLTTLWMIHLGDSLLWSGRATELAPRHKTDYSAFRLGRDYLQRCRTLGHRLPIGFTMRHTA